MLNLGALVATLGIDSSGLAMSRREMMKWEAQAKRSVASVNASLRTTGAEMKKVGRSMTRYVTLPLALAGAAAFKLSKDFEFSLSKITSLVGVSAEQVKKWGEEILVLAPQLGKAPKELAEALFFVTSAGLRGAQAMDVLIMSAKASASGLGETKIVADLVTSAMNAYGPAVLNASMATDILVNTIRKGKVEADALTGSLGWVIPVSSALGVSFDQVGAAVASMTRTGTSARTASVQLRQILFSMLKPSDQARDALEAMGTSASRLRKTLREDGLIATLLELKNLQKEYGEETLATVFPNIRALAGVLDIVGANMENNIDIFKSLSDSTDLAAKAFEVASNTVEFKWNQALAQSKTTLIEFGKVLNEMLLPLLQGAINLLQRLVNWWKSLGESQKRLVITITALTAALGPLLLVLGFLVGNVLPGLIIVGHKAVLMFNALKLAMAANPLTFFIGVLAIVATALLTFRKRAEEATVAQTDLNKAILAGAEAWTQTRSVEERVGIIRELNKRQLEDLKMSILLQSALIEDNTAVLLTETKKRVGIIISEKEANELLARSIVDGYRLSEEEKTAIANQQAAKTVANTKKSNDEQLALLDTYLNQVEDAMRKVKEKEEFGLVRPRDTTPISKLTPVNIDLPSKFSALIVPELENLQKALGQVNREMLVFGDATLAAQQRQALLKESIVTLLSQGISPTNAIFQELVTNYEMAIVATEKLTEETKRLNEEQEKTARIVSMVGNTVANTTVQILSTLGSALAGTAGAWESLVSIIISGAQEIINQLLLMAIAGMIAKETENEGVWGLAVAAIGVAALAALWSGYQSDASSMAGMAEGGIVPQGFPNDSYPALLTTGERVIPAALPLPPDLGGSGTGQVIFEIQGRKLVGILRQEQLFDNSY